jgi:hypothetical protein
LTSFSDAILPICVISTGLAYGLGVGPVLHSLLGEILPQRVKSFAVSIIFSIRSMATFLNLKVWQFRMTLIKLVILIKSQLLGLALSVTILVFAIFHYLQKIAYNSIDMVPEKLNCI